MLWTCVAARFIALGGIVVPYLERDKSRSYARLYTSEDV
jgi:hypothetical protein